MKVVGVLPGDSAQATDLATIDLAKSSGLSDATPFGDMVQDRLKSLWRKPGVEVRRPLRSDKRALHTPHRNIRRSSWEPKRLVTVRFPAPRFPSSEQPKLRQQKRERSSMVRLGRCDPEWWKALASISSDRRNRADYAMGVGHEEIVDRALNRDPRTQFPSLFKSRRAPLSRDFFSAMKPG